MEFEVIKTNDVSTIKRARVFGGWIVLIVDDSLSYPGLEWDTKAMFIPDQHHQWNVEVIL